MLNQRKENYGRRHDFFALTGALKFISKIRIIVGLAGEEKIGLVCISLADYFFSSMICISITFVAVGPVMIWALLPEPASNFLKNV